MLNKRQIGISDILLNNLKLSAEDPETKYYIDELRESGYEDFEVTTLIEILINHYNLVYYHTENFHVRTLYYLILAPEGNKAAEIGIKKYIEEIEEDKQLDRKAKKASIITSRWAIGISIVSVIIAFTVPFLVEVFKNKIVVESEYLKDSTNNHTKQTDNSANKSDSRLPFNRMTARFIEEIKDSLKHDTKFLNELKLELKRNPTEN